MCEETYTLTPAGVTHRLSLMRRDGAVFIPAGHLDSALEGRLPVEMIREYLSRYHWSLMATAVAPLKLRSWTERGGGPKFGPKTELPDWAAPLAAIPHMHAFGVVLGPRTVGASVAYSLAGHSSILTVSLRPPRRTAALD